MGDYNSFLLWFYKPTIIYIFTWICSVFKPKYKRIMQLIFHNFFMLTIFKNGKKLYTEQDKLEYLIKKNPELAQLKTRFNLDFDDWTFAN